MYFEMMCSCSASIHMDVAEDMQTLGLLFLNRFIESHVNCGFMTPMHKDVDDDIKLFKED